MIVDYKEILDQGVIGELIMSSDFTLHGLVLVMQQN